MEITAQYIVIHDCCNCSSITFLRNKEELNAYVEKHGLGSFTEVFKRTTAYNELTQNKEEAKK